MRVAAVLILTPLLLAGCSSDSKSYIPPGTYAGSTAADQPFTLEVGEKVRVNKIEGRFVKRGVIEVDRKGLHVTLACKVTDPKGEELRCALKFPGAGGLPAVSTDIDLMLL